VPDGRPPAVLLAWFLLAWFLLAWFLLAWFLLGWGDRSGPVVDFDM